MSVTIFNDVEEALAREVRRITFNDSRTLSKSVLQESFDPFTGELLSIPIDPDFYDSSADTRLIDYPHFFIKLQKTREDRFTKRTVPPYGRWCQTYTTTSPKAFEIIVTGSDGLVNSAGDTFSTSIYKISKVQPGYLLRLLAGNNVGTYIIDSIVKDVGGNHSIILSDTLLQNLPALDFDSNARRVIFKEPVDLNTIEPGDIFKDSSDTEFTINTIDISSNSFTLFGVGAPSLSLGGSVRRSGDILKNEDLSLVRFLVMDPTKPVKKLGSSGIVEANSKLSGVSPEIPIDAYYLIRIDSKDRDTHRDVLNRIWEEFNPPRGGLPVIKRTTLSTEELLTADIPSGGSSTVEVKDNTNFKIGDSVFIFNDLEPTKDLDSGGFGRPFESKIINTISNNQLILADVVPDRFKLEENSKIVSNAELRILMFHFVDHTTRDIEGAQYWSHEFSFWVQIWVDRLENAEELSTVTDTATPIGDIATESIIIEDS